MRRHALTLPLFLAIAVAMTWPLARHLTTAVPGPPQDVLAYLYELWWCKHALLDLHVSPFFNPNLYHPTGYNTLLTHITPASSLLAVPLTALWGEVVAYNLSILAFLTIAGFGAYLFVELLTGRRLAGVVGGAAFAFSPYVLGRLVDGHLPLVAVHWIPLLFYFIERTIAERRCRFAAAAGACFALNAFSSPYYGYMVGLFAAAYTLLRLRGAPAWPSRRRLGYAVALATATGLVPLIPFAVATARLRSHESLGYPSIAALDVLSASPDHLLLPNPLHALWRPLLLHFYDGNVTFVALGTINLLLAVIGLRRRQSRPLRVVAWLGAIAAILALGATLHVFGHRVLVPVPVGVERAVTAVERLAAESLAPHRAGWDVQGPGTLAIPLPSLLLFLFLPLFDLLRVWARFAVVTSLAVATFAGLGAARVLDRARARFAPSRWVPAAVGGGLLLFVLADLCPWPFPFGRTEVGPQPLDRWLAGRPEQAAVMQFPVERAEFLTRATYGQRFHGKPLAYGYGTFQPKTFLDARPVLDRFPDDEALALLRRWGVGFIVVAPQDYGQRWAAVAARLAARTDLALAAELDDRPAHVGDFARARQRAKLQMTSGRLLVFTFAK